VRKNNMCALASLPARAASRVRKIEAEAPALAAAATCPLGLSELLHRKNALLLLSMGMPTLYDPECVRNGLTLSDARCLYNNSDSRAAMDMLASCLRRLVWRDVLADREPPLSRQEEECCSAWL